MSQRRAMTAPSSWILVEPYAGLQSQMFGLAEAGGLTPALKDLLPRWPWRKVSPSLWPAPLRAVPRATLARPFPDILLGGGGKAAPILAALGKLNAGSPRRVMVQHPRMDIRKFDLVVTVRHDEVSGPNVLVTRTALHRATPARLAEAAAIWGPRLAHLPRPLVAVLVGGSNGRFRLDAPVAAALAGQVAEMMRLDRVGLALTPSRRTDPAARRIFAERLRPLGAEVWDMTGDNPYYGLLALADAIVVTGDSVSMISEAVATAAPVMVAALPGRSHRIGVFTRALIDEGRVRPYQGRLEHWSVAPLDDTAEAGAEMVRRLGF
jgi:mitochondrial fission protein ELM1